jgi:hypothetical protein
MNWPTNTIAVYLAVLLMVATLLANLAVNYYFNSLNSAVVRHQNEQLASFSTYLDVEFERLSGLEYRRLKQLDAKRLSKIEEDIKHLRELLIVDKAKP